MEPIKLIDNPNFKQVVGNNPINVPNSNINKIAGPSVISTIDGPAIRSVEQPVVRGLEVPIVDVPNTTIKYPVINVPTQAEFDAAVNAERQKQAQEEKQKEREGEREGKKRGEREREGRGAGKFYILHSI